MAVCLVAVLFLLPLAGASQEEAILPDGQRLAGELVLDKKGQLRFVPKARTSSFLLAQVAQVRFPACSLPPFRIAAAHRVNLRAEQFLTVQFLGLDEKNLRLRTAWRDELTIPREAVVSLCHATGLVTFFQEDFENGLKAWKLTGQLAVTDRMRTSGIHSLCLNGIGQAAEYKLPVPLEAGRAGINFHEAGNLGGAHWLVEADFDGAPGRRAMQVILGGHADGFEAKVSGGTSGTGRLRRSPGWHRLTIDFTGNALTVAVDDDILWFGRRPQTGGTLQTVRLACRPNSAGGSVSGEVCFDDFSLAQAVRKLPRPEGDPGQDELWLLSGDQLFGSVPRATRSTIDLRGLLGTHSYDWGQVRGIFFRQPSGPLPRAAGEEVRIWLRSGLSPEPDELVGKINGLNKGRLLLRHEVLGELAIDRGRLHRLRPEPLALGE